MATAPIRTITSNASSGAGTTFLFAHGAGFCKQVWDPVIRRLQQQLPAPSSRFVTFDFSHHGTNQRGDSASPRAFYPTPESPRVILPDIEWSSTVIHQASMQALQLRFQSERTNQRLIGVGHSMGAAALWLSEVRHPGTFDGLVLFEPINGFKDVTSTGLDDARPEYSKSVDILVALTLQRESQWPSRAAAVEHFTGLRSFAAWDSEALAAFLDGALLAQPDGSVVLACRPETEASMYRDTPMYLSQADAGVPLCRISIQRAARSRMFSSDVFAPVVEQYPHIYSMADPIPNTSHAMVMEAPAVATQRILTAMDHFAQVAHQQPSYLASNL